MVAAGPQVAAKTTHSAMIASVFAAMKSARPTASGVDQCITTCNRDRGPPRDLRSVNPEYDVALRRRVRVGERARKERAERPERPIVVPGRVLRATGREGTLCDD